MPVIDSVAEDRARPAVNAAPSGLAATIVVANTPPRNKRVQRLDKLAAGARNCITSRLSADECRVVVCGDRLVVSSRPATESAEPVT